MEISAQNMNKIGYTLFINGNTAKWKTILDKTRFSDQMTEQNLDLLYLYYGFIAYNIGIEKMNIAETYLNKAQKQLDKLLTKHPQTAKLLAMQAAFYGFRIGISPYKAVYYGPKSVDFAERALKADNKCAVVYMELGNIEFYKPAIFGGSKEKSLKRYQEAVLLFEKNKKTTYNWLYLNTLSSLAANFAEFEQYRKALAIYNKILAFEPNYLWVRDKLKPTLEKQLSN